MARACRQLEGIPLARTTDPNRALFELRNMHTVALLIARCALTRQESRGAHYRTDFPESRPQFQKHSLVSRGHEVTFF